MHGKWGNKTRGESQYRYSQSFVHGKKIPVLYTLKDCFFFLNEKKEESLWTALCKCQLHDQWKPESLTKGRNSQGRKMKQIKCKWLVPSEKFGRNGVPQMLGLWLSSLLFLSMNKKISGEKLRQKPP